MANKCNHCGKFLSPTEGAKCSQCSNLFHRGCANITLKGPTPAKWQCFECRGKIKSPNNQDIRRTDERDDVYADASAPTEDPTLTLVNEIKLLREEIKSLHNDNIRIAREMASIRQEFTVFNSTINELNSRVSDVEERISVLESKVSGQPCTAEATDDQSVILQLRQEINEREQENLLNDIVIQGLEERSSENINHIVSLAAKKIGVDLEDRDIVSAERAGPRRAHTDGEERPRPRPIIVRVTRRAIRDQLLRAARVRRGADSMGVVDGQVRRFYVNERLTRSNAQLFFKAREIGGRKDWKFIWTKGGHIFVRKDANSIIHRIRSENDIKKFFGID